VLLRPEASGGNPTSHMGSGECDASESLTPRASSWMLRLLEVHVEGFGGGRSDMHDDLS
jgi:hypothetical protein